jgi:hypothetical protein
LDLSLGKNKTNPQKSPNFILDNADYEDKMFYDFGPWPGRDSRARSKYLGENLKTKSKM